MILEGKLAEEHYESLLEPWSEATAELEAAGEAALLEEPDADSLEDEDDDLDEEDEGEFGPNSNLLTDFMTRLWLLTPEQVGRLVGSWQNTDRDDLKAAHDNLREVIDEDARVPRPGAQGSGEARRVAECVSVLRTDLLPRRDRHGGPEADGRPDTGGRGGGAGPGRSA